MPKPIRGQTRRAYSYIRFSTPEQRLGDSFRRQVALSKAWCQRNGYVLDESFDLHDLGVSAFRGKNATQGKLAAFLRAVEDERIPAGSVLLVESLDRLTRNEIGEALELFLGILRNGVTIVTLQPEEVFDKKSINDLVKIIVVLVVMSRAHEESLTKSKRIRASRDTAFDAARETGRIVTKQCPWWLNVEDGAFVVIPEAQETIRRIFDLRLQGVGSVSVAKTLNESAAWTPPPRKKADREAGKSGNGWRASYVKKICGYRAVFGEFQPHRTIEGKRIPTGDPIPDYYPAIVDPDVFNALQSKLSKASGNATNSGRTGKATNLFRHLAKCAYCGGPMQFVDKSKKGFDWRYLQCDKGKRGVGCAHRSIRYAEVEALVLDNCHLLRPEQILPAPDDHEKQARALRQRIAAAVGEIATIEEQNANLMDQVGRTKSPTMRDQYENRIIENEAKLQAAAKRRDADAAKLSRMESGAKSLATWQRDLKELRKALYTGDVDVRVKTQTHFREIIDRVEVFAHGHAKAFDPSDRVEGAAGRPAAVAKRARTKPGRRERADGQRPSPYPVSDDVAVEIEEGLRESSPEKFRDAKWVKQFRVFVRYLLDRRMSKDGRFVRVWFKSGMAVDLVPTGSIASGHQPSPATRGRGVSIRHVGPDFEALWSEFAAKG